jgi:hypothetical protein
VLRLGRAPDCSQRGQGPARDAVFFGFVGSVGRVRYRPRLRTPQLFYLRAAASGSFDDAVLVALRLAPP